MSLYASDPGLFSAIEIQQQCVIITRGENLEHAAAFQFEKMINIAGDREAKLIISKDTAAQQALKSSYRKIKSWFRRQ